MFSLFWGSRRRTQWTDIILHGGAQLVNFAWGSSTGDLRRLWRWAPSSTGALEMQHLSLWELCEGNLKGAPLLGTLKVMLKRALVMSISFHGDPAGEPGRGLIYQGP